MRRSWTRSTPLHSPGQARAYLEYRTMRVDKLQSAQLLVVLPGTRTSFRRRVIDALRELVPASGAFCFFGKEDGRPYGDPTRLVDGATKAVKGDHNKLSGA